MSFTGVMLGACADDTVAEGPAQQSTADAGNHVDSGVVDAASHTDSSAVDAASHTDSSAVDATGATDQGTKDDQKDAPPASPDSSADALACMTPADIIIGDARSHLGDPYVWGGEDCSGYDCSGLVWAVFKETGYFDIIGNGSARTVGAIATVFSKQGLEDMDTSKLPEPGDLITFGDYAHIGIYEGEKNEKGTSNAKGWVVNALNENYGVVENKVDAITPTVHSFLHTGLSSQPCTPTDFVPAGCP